MPFRNPTDQNPEEYVAGRFVQERATASAGAYVHAALTGENPSNYDSGWAEIADQFHEQFPNINHERARDVYLQSRDQATVAGLTSTRQGGLESEQRTAHGRVPFVGTAQQLQTSFQDRRAVERVRDGDATLGDYAQVRELQGHNEFLAARGIGRQALDVVAQTPAFGVEIAATGGVTRGVAAGLGRLAVPAARTGLGVAGTAARFGAGGIAGHALTGRGVAGAAQSLVPDVARDANGNLHIGGDRTAGDAFRGYLDSQIEYWSEMSGAAILRGSGTVLSRLPGAARAQAVASGLAARVASNPRLRSALVRAGYHGALGEFMEERAGELARGATGVGDFGLTGNVASGHWQEAINQLAVEGLAFGGMQVGITGASMAASRINRSPGNVAIQALERQGVAPAAARAQVMAAAESVANGTAEPADVRPGPLRTLAEAIQERVQEAEQTPTAAQAAVEDARSGTAPRIRQAAEGTRQPGFMRTQAQAPAKTIPAPEVAPSAASETSVPMAPPTEVNARNSEIRGELATSQLPDAPSAAAPPVADAITDSPEAPRAQQPAQSGPEVAQTTPDALAPPKTGAPEALSGLWLKHFSGETGIREQINAAAGLSEREAGILWGRLPKEQGGDGRSLESIGKEQGVSRQRIEQIEKKLRSKASFDVSVDQFKRQAAGLEREGSSVVRQRDAGFGVERTRGQEAGPPEGFQTQESPQLPEEILSDAMMRILESDPPLTEPQMVRVLQNYNRLAEKIENAKGRARKAGFSPAAIERALRAGLQDGAAEKADEKARDRDPGREALHISEASGAAAASSRPLTPADLKAVASLSPHHAAAVQKVGAMVWAANLPIENKVEYLRNQLTILSSMPETAAALYSAGLSAARFHVSTKALGEAMAPSSEAVREALAEGVVIGGVYNRASRVIDLDGGTADASGARIAGHEAAHAIDGPREDISNSPKIREAYLKEGLKGTLGDYSRTDAHEFLAETLGLIYSREMTPGALEAQMPLTYKALAGRGLIKRADGKAEFDTPADVFDTAINDGPLHADTLRLHVSKEFAAARAHVNPTGEPNSKFATNAEALADNKKEAALTFRERADDRFAVVDDIAAEVASKRKRLGLAPAREGDDLRTVFANTDRAVQAWAEKMAAEGAFVFDLAPDGARTMRTIGKPVAWMTEGLGFTDEDFQPIGAGKFDSLKRKFNLPAPQGGSRFETMLTALHAVNQVERGSQMVQKYKTFITAEQEAVAARLLNTVSQEQLSAFNAWIETERKTDPNFVAASSEALLRITQLNDWTLESLQSVGHYSAQDVARIKRDYPDYISLARVLEEDDIKGKSGSEIRPGWEKKRHGSGEQILSPIMSLSSRYAQTAVMMAKQIKDEALVEAVRNLEGEHVKLAAPEAAAVRLTDIAEKLTAIGVSKADQQALIDIIGPELIEHFGYKKWQDSGKNIYIVKVNGERAGLEITNEHLYNLLTGNQTPLAMTSGIVNAVLAIPGAKTLKPIIQFMATRLSPTFWVRNPLRDPFTALQNRSKGVAETLEEGGLGHVAAAKAAYQTLRGQAISDPIYAMYNEDTGQQVRTVGYVRTGKGAAALRKLLGTTPTAERMIHAGEKFQDFLELVGFPEHSWRFAAYNETLEEHGYTVAKIEAAKKAHPDRSPVPLHIRRAAAQRASERTTDFGRQGIDAREYNQVKPFLSSEIAGISQELRNVKGAVEEMRSGKFGRKSERMVYALATLLAFELLHWWLFKDREWYKNLPKHQRYDWWVLGQLADGSTIGLPKPHGFAFRKITEFFQETLRTTSGSEPRFGMATGLDQPLSNIVDAGVARLPVIASETAQIMRNRDWRGAPVVPARDLRELNDWEQFRRHQLPYVINQLTGGLTSGRIIQAIQNPLSPLQSSRSEPNLPVNEYYARLETLTGARTRANRTGQPLPQEEAREYARLHSVETLMRNLAREARGDGGRKPSPERLREIRQIQNRLARRALGLKET